MDAQSLDTQRHLAIAFEGNLENISKRSSGIDSELRVKRGENVRTESFMAETDSKELVLFFQAFEPPSLDRELDDCSNLTSDRAKSYSPSH